MANQTGMGNNSGAPKGTPAAPQRDPQKGNQSGVQKDLPQRSQRDISKTDDAQDFEDQ